jgi:hypothetical protein
MTSDAAPSIEVIRQLAQQAGLNLSDEKLKELMPGIGRNLERAQRLEKWVSQDVEPATGSLVTGAEDQNGR